MEERRYTKRELWFAAAWGACAVLFLVMLGLALADQDEAASVLGFLLLCAGAALFEKS